MSASQLTPRANPVPLPEKLLPTPPSPSSPSSSDVPTCTSPASLLTANTLKALPAHPTFNRSCTEPDCIRGVPATHSASPAYPPRSKSTGNTASFLNFDSSSSHQPSFTLQKAQQGLAIRASVSPESSPPQTFYSPRMAPESPRTTHKPAQSKSVASIPVSNSICTPARPSLSAHHDSNASAAPPRHSSAENAPSFDPSAFPVMGAQHDCNYQSSPASQRLSSQHTHFSSDDSVRNSSSTHTSVWTDRSLTSCATSPACTPYNLKSHVRGKPAGAGDTADELDESSVGLGITSDLEHGMSSRRSSAALVLPSTMLPASARALQGPFSHHRAPSWTRRVDVSPLAGLHSHSSGYADGHASPFQDKMRAFALNSGLGMQRALSDVMPVSSASEDIAAAVASASSSAIVNPTIPLRRDSRARCSSDLSNYRSAASASPLSTSSPTSNSGRFTPAVPSTWSGLGGGHLDLLQSPPRNSSLRAPSYLTKGSSPPTPPASASQRPPCPTLDRITTINDLSNSIFAVQEAPEAVSDPNSPTGSVTEPSLRTSSAASSRRRRVSDVSINSFLQNGEFSHIVGAYTSKMRWEEGLYDFDENAEMDGDESRAVATAEDGSATIVQGRDLTLEQIQTETGPNTTHLLLSGNQSEGLVQVLERVLPLTTNLLVLDLSNCHLQRLPDAIGACIALEELDISRNPVGCLPDWILNLRALRTMSADCIGLHHLPSSLIQLQELQRLSLRHNQLVFLPSWLHRMSKLNNLFVEGNCFGGPWQDIVAPLLSQFQRPLAAPWQPAPSQQLGDASEVPVRSSSATHVGLHQAPERPFMARMRSANDLQSMLSGPFGARTPPASARDSHNDDSGYFSPRDAHARPATGYEDHLTELPGADGADPHVAGSGKWGGFLKKIGRKASNQRLSAGYHDQTTSPNESRFSSPKASRKSLRSSTGPSRSNSISKNSPTPVISPSQSENICPPISIASRNLAAAVGQDSGSQLAPMTPLGPPSEPLMLSRPATFLQPSLSSAEAKKARRRSFLPVLANAAVASPHAAAPSQEEMDEESLARHSNRLRALMHYLRDLDDLTAARTEATSFVGPSKSALVHLRDVSGHSRSTSMHRAESSNPSTKSRDSGGEYVASTAASSISEGASSEPARLSTAQCSKDDSVRRFRIIAEIVSTERTYVKGLSELVDIYVKPAMAPADGNSGVAVIPPSEHRAVFGNVEALLQFHRTVFLPSLVAMAGPVLEHDQDAPADMAPEETAAVAEKVASVFSTHAAFFKMYSSYINNCDSAQNRINAWTAPPASGTSGSLSLRGAPGYSTLHSFGASSAPQGTAAAMYASGSNNGAMSTNAGSGIFGADGGLSPSQRKKVRTFMKRCRTHPRHAQLNVESYLLLPVQRIPRYRLLLEDLVKSTDPSRLADGDALATALEHVTQIASKVNESKRQSEQDRRLLAWQYRIRGPIDGPLVQPHRRLLKDGTLQLKRVVRRIPGFVRSDRSVSVGTAEQRQSQSHVLSADHLQQVTEDQSMSLILCSDVAVLCAEQTRSKDGNAPVLLRSMLKLTRPAEILGGLNLRIVDRAEILYLAASSPEEAVAWKTAFDLHFYQ
ncbi:uncharacterized protein UMAG_00736 [Mycosarcoma maydis]|uniref:DH domain-containing protein n=1 Tax=Mycosarcoma maydis TaxID=5270 RepID=A0A0D1E902_MYCMD|nr:uncharacterized protein UMAG_00736 [Ustilago maydis 521]KIS72329.1 hypothetical protein UMAG_00736 [Ustilago maydis 521]|eukprot:XP_011386518.1 hypothetical protein UMAG_00736 [Ustilago maydis 521]